MAKKGKEKNTKNKKKHTKLMNRKLSKIRVEKEKRKKDKPIIKEKDVFDNWKNKKRKSKSGTKSSK